MCIIVIRWGRKKKKNLRGIRTCRICKGSSNWWVLSQLSVCGFDGDNSDFSWALKTLLCNDWTIVKRRSFRDSVFGANSTFFALLTVQSPAIKEIAKKRTKVRKTSLKIISHSNRHEIPDKIRVRCYRTPSRHIWFRSLLSILANLLFSDFLCNNFASDGPRVSFHGKSNVTLPRNRKVF